MKTAVSADRIGRAGAACAGGLRSAREAEGWAGGAAAGRRCSRSRRFTGQIARGAMVRMGKNGAATNLANPEYQALIDDASLREVIAKGERER